ncbi:hypothetical protein N7505_001260 [Penicillium chrysogenum]|uniref:Uncharacterized protein n=1 Tax=Penicillium chrysogenum TaxID=5076 RepID=A0ABQ8WXC5_PENCH|nr:hypothetical protein N7505_001260 [Penicillium chrysogenum]
MSAPKAGRQSPEPEHQSGAQQRDPMFSKHTTIDTRPAAELGQELSEGSSLQLPSNPVPHLEEIEAGKYGKAIRNYEEGSL